MDKNKKSTIVTVVIIIAVVIEAVLIFVFSGKNENQEKGPEQNLANVSGEIKMENKTLADGLRITDEIVGTGAEAKTGNLVSVNYVGTLADGKNLDSSYD